jgi:hypothetical protein
MELSSNDLAKECLKYSYGIIYHILEVVLSSKDEHYLGIIIPLLYYFCEHKSVIDYMLSTYKQLEEKFKLLHSYCLEYLRSQEKELEGQANAGELARDYILSSDKLVLGFIPVMKYIERHELYKKRLLQGENEEKLIKWHLVADLIDTLGIGASTSKVLFIRVVL